MTQEKIEIVSSRKGSSELRIKKLLDNPKADFVEVVDPTGEYYEVIEEKQRRFGNLRDSSTKTPIKTIDFEAYAEGQNHAKETKLIPEELVE